MSPFTSGETEAPEDKVTSSFTQPTLAQTKRSPCVKDSSTRVLHLCALHTCIACLWKAPSPTTACFSCVKIILKMTLRGLQCHQCHIANGENVA